MILYVIPNASSPTLKAVTFIYSRVGQQKARQGGLDTFVR